MKQLREFCKILQEINATKEEARNASCRLAQLKNIKNNATKITIIAEANGTSIDCYTIDEYLNVQELLVSFILELEGVELRNLFEAKSKLKRLSEELAQIFNKKESDNEN